MRGMGEHQQGIDGQQAQVGTQSQALRHRTRGAQARESARASAKSNRIQFFQVQLRLIQQAHDGGDQGRGGLRTTGTLMLPALVTSRQRQRHAFGAAIDGK